MTDLDKQIVRELQKDIRLSNRPFLEIANKLSISEQELLNKIDQLKKQGVIRRFGAILKHRNAGFKANVMVVWQVPQDRVTEVAEILALDKNVSHCYERQTSKDWSYNLYSMIHGTSKKECYQTINLIKDKCNITEYQALFSTAELKKTSMEYFTK